MDENHESEIEELNRTLEKERGLVLRTQENYGNLKTKYLELTEQMQAVRDEMQMRLSECGQQQEALLRVSDDLKADNDLLREQVVQLQRSLDEARKKARAREEEMKKEFSDQIELLLVECTNNNAVEELASKFEDARKSELLQHDSRVQKLLSEIRSIQTVADEESRSLKAELSEERHRRIELEALAQRSRMELEAARKLIASKQNELNVVRSELNRRMKEMMEEEIAWLSKEENFRATLMQRTASFEKSVAGFERTVSEKDALIADLRNTVKKLEEDYLPSMTSNLVKGDESRKSVQESEEMNSLLRAAKLTEEKNIALIEQLKRERNSLEVTVAELKKNRETQPSQTKELNRLRALLREKEEKLRASRRKYQQLMHKVEVYLIQLEKRQHRTKCKLEETIMSSY